MNKPHSTPFDAGAELNSVLSVWLRSMKARRGLQFRTVPSAATAATAATHAEIVRRAGLPFIMTASTTAYDKLGGEAATLVLEMTTAMLERMTERFNSIETGNWLAADLAVKGVSFDVVIQNIGGVICSVVALPGEVGNPPADHGYGPTCLSDGQTRFTGTGRRRASGRRQ